MSAVPESPPLTGSRNWWLAAGLTVGVLIMLIGLFWPTVRTMIEIWDISDTYTHGYFIFPLSAWLLWRMRNELSLVQPRPDPMGLVVLAAAGAAWLLADAGSVNVVAQYAFVTILIAAVWTLLGRTFLWAALFPLAYLYLAVPVGAGLIQPMVDITADIAVSLLRVTGIPVYRDGNFFSVPSGNWSVVEACAGINYLIASFTLGVLFAYLTYRSWHKRILFSLAAIVVPILANGFRAYMIVMIGHLSDMRLAVGVDHFIYGWVWFGIVMLLLFWIGSFWREDHEPAVRSSSPPVPPSKETQFGRMLPLALATLATSAIWPAYSWWLGQRELPAMPDVQVEAQGGWQTREAFTDWSPHWTGADWKMTQSYGMDGNDVMLELNYYATQRQGSELVSSQNYLLRHIAEAQSWMLDGRGVTTVSIGNEARQVIQARLRGYGDQKLLVWQWNVIDGKPVVNDHLAALTLALNRVLLKRDDGLSVLIATPYEDTDIQTASATLARFAADMEPAIARTLDQVDGP
jgi:exosortase A